MYQSVLRTRCLQTRINKHSNFLFSIVSNRETKSNAGPRDAKENCAEYFMRAKKYECLTTCTNTPWKFTTLRDRTARFCRECKFVSCYLHKVERRHNRFRRGPDEKGSLVFKTFKICSVDGTAIASYRYRTAQLRTLIDAIILFKKYIFLLTRYQ